jgi:prepilin-type processing-associated H-X9-DG protein
LTAFVLVTGEGTAFPDGRGLRFDQITDGTSNTLMVTEACGQGIVWTDPRDVDVGRHPIAVNAPGSRSGRSPGILSSYHPSGAQVAMADGSVQYIPANIDPEVLRRLTTAAAEDHAE